MSTKVKLQIRNRWTGKVLFEYEKENNTIKDTLLAAIAAGSDLRGSDLSGSDLSGSDLRGSDLSDSNLSGSNLRGSDLRGSDLSDSNLSGSDLSDSNLRGSDLSGSDLSGSDLSGSDLSGSDLRDSDLRGSDLRDANLTPIKEDMFIVLLHAIPEIPALKKAILDGKIDGSTYSGACSCLSGTVCSAAPTEIDLQRAMRVRSSSRPIERFFLGIKPGHTPENSQHAKLALQWIEEFETLIATARA